MLEEEFRVDDHRYWENSRKKQPPNQQMQQKWKDIDEKMETDLETFSKEAAEKNGDFLGELRVENRERHDYREFLRKFSVFREELQPIRILSITDFTATDVAVWKYAFDRTSGDKRRAPD